ncbi:PAS domain-containing sensor histidine kinase [Mucilaginibacter sp. PPCGB 2223]|uniref:PAS domain-containing sensor histidine kinase n=1 Tax=Mucilaginibacter sp. PPCGB 2223 TaxID=1886027 RepID=UPI0009F5A87D|nr:PAS domain-containing sensor histidine kinase [Mucilaginibacter sp. PPCGB 2223]
MTNFDFLFYSNPQPMWIFDTNSLQMLEVNTAALQQYGYTKEEFLNLTIWDLRADKSKPDLEQTLSEIKGNGLNIRELQHITKDKKILYVELVSFLIAYQDVRARLAYAHNINSEKEIRNKLDSTRNKLDRILESTSIGFFQTDFDFNVTYWNNAAENLIGYSKEQVIGNNLWTTFPEVIDTDFYNYMHSSLKSGINVEFTGYFWPVQKWFAIYGYATPDGLTVHFRDITEKKIAEEKLLEKIDQMKEVSYLNSHLIRKPIATLLGLASLIKDEAASPEEYKQISKYIYDCSMELDEAVRQVNKKVNDEDELYGISYEMKDFAFNELVKEIVAKLQSQGVKNTMMMELTKDSSFYGNKTRIKIALECLIDNAVKYSTAASNIILRTEVIEQSLIFSIQDFGAGIPHYTLNKLCANLANREITRSGTSGLYKVAEIIRKHNGSIWVESEEGKGSTFSLRLPFSNFSAIKNYGTPVISAYHDTGISVTYDEDGKYVYANWRGFQNFQTVKRGCTKIIEGLIEYHCPLLLNDNLKVMGTWADAVQWVIKECFPMLEKAGLTHLAWIYSPSTFSRMAADQTIQNINGPITIKTFGDKKSAIEWLTKAGVKVGKE